MKWVPLAFLAFLSTGASASINARIAFKNFERAKIVVVVSVENTSERDMCINSAALGISGETSDPLFNVERDGKQLSYLGVREIRSSQSVRSFVVLMPHQELSVTHNITSQFDFSSSGHYKVTYDTLSIGHCLGEGGGLELRSNVLEFKK